MSYWQQTLARRLSRRRALAATGATALGAALLAACGDDEPQSSGGAKDRSGLITRPADETKNARRGGTLKHFSAGEPSHFDPHLAGGSFTTTSHIFSTLFRIKDGYLENTTGDVEGDLVDAWEFSPDKLNLVVKLSQAHFSPLPPVNGRQVDAQDIVFSWERLKYGASNRGDFSAEINPNAPIVSLEATDERTLVFRFREPNATVTSLLASNTPGNLLIVPRESHDGAVLDLRKTPIGSGPWYLSDSQTGSGFFFKRNPGFKQDKRDLPYMDGIDLPLVRDYATGITQFRAGAIYGYTPHAVDVLSAKRDLPVLHMYETGISATGLRTAFGLRQGSAFRDERVRQAWVLAWDRDVYIDVLHNVKKLQEEGLPVDTAYNTALSASSWRGWWLDPMSKDFGANDKYFVYNLAEAKKLLSAAGHTNGVDTEIHHPANSGAGSSYPSAYYQQLETLLGVVQSSNLFRWKIDTPNFNTDWTPLYRAGHADFNGIAMLYDTQVGDPAANLHARYHSSGAMRQGTDPVFDDMLLKSMREFDAKKRQAYIHEVQRVEGARQFFPWVGGGGGFTLSWPIVRNVMVYQGGTGRDRTTIFLDPERPPAKRF